MSLYQDRQIKGFLLFLTLFALLFVGTATVLTIYQVNDAEVLWLKHDEAVSSSLLEQGVPKEVVAVAFTNTDISDDGRSLLAAAGLGKQSESSMRPYFNQFQRSAFCTMLCTVLFFLFVLAIGIFIFFWKRKRLYQQADKILLNYINGDYSCHLPQNYEGAIYQVFSSVEQLATIVRITWNRAPAMFQIFMKEEQRTIFRRRNIGFIFQSFQLVSELNVEQNIMFPLLLDYRKPDPAAVEEILELLGLTERRHHLPSQLSGGQQQRVAIGRALITKPKLILADEPTGNLDSKNSQDVIALLTQASRRYQQTILMITHNKDLTASVDRVFRVSDGVLTDLGGKTNEALS